MNPSSSKLKFYNIPAGAGFAAALVEGVLTRAHTLYGDDPSALPRFRILLPTRRGCRVIRDMFLQHSEGRPLILPRLQAIGDVDEDELSLQLTSDEDISRLLQLKPAMPPNRRRLLLAQLVQEKEKGLSWGKALGLADTLARLLDQVETEGLDLRTLPQLVDEAHLAAHWQETVKFLNIISQAWPALLEEKGYMGPAARRDNLLRLQAEIWQRRAPDGHVIAAGSTGSLPATRHLLKTIASLQEGCVVLPGLDQDMTANDWQHLNESHPQATLRSLLHECELTREDIPLWHAAACMADSRSKNIRRKLAAQMMRPAPETYRWVDLKPGDIGLLQAEDIDDLQQKLWSITCATPEEEARLIALMLRQTLETAGKTAALITPDRNLARRVTMACRRWGIEVDDSAGIPLSDTPVGSYILLIIQACSRHLAPAALLPLLQHEFCGLGFSKPQRDNILHNFDHYLLRGARPAAGIEGLKARLEELRQGRQQAEVEPISWQLSEAINKISESLSPLLQSGSMPGGILLRLVLQAAESFANTPEARGSDRIWWGAAGEGAALFFADLAGHAGDMPILKLDDLFDMLSRMMGGVTVRTPVGMHPRLRILGQLEARLVQADLMIAAGLNEGMWPPDPGQDPWMSRPMRQRFGLPAPERGTALAAHDFVQCFCADRVVLTRASRIDGKPTIPSRWLQRMETVFKAIGLEGQIGFPPAAQQLLTIARLSDQVQQPKPATRPAPCPPAASRLKSLSITQIETWLTNPYGIYAAEILRLKPLDPVEKPVGQAERGTFIHDVLQEFTKQYGEQLPDNADKIIIDLGNIRRTSMSGDTADWDYWWPRFERIAETFAIQESEWRTDSAQRMPEIKGKLDIHINGHTFTLKGRADRIDRMHDDTYAIIDYKSGGNFAKSGLQNGRHPQLPLEALILQAGGFDGLAAGKASYIGYWKLTGGKKASDTTVCLGTEEEVQNAVDNAWQGLEELIRIYSLPETPFTCRPDPERVPRFDDYKQLSRLDEWAHGEDEPAEEAA
ncbi:MAG: double-strand break repair protein AddB [Micavibrio aeruginosavorus]|uniref:Double-strand break repair protein AddB n=1 Tax=Micavibrio aeruginosavorus TaxID=349221 RepID=A0A7T5UI31_9BACT|nr:MAG: double-strand break repair protein AddB [Micavibrio aeruginosavorus]